MLEKENKELTESTKNLSESFDRFLQLLKELCEEVRKLKEKVTK